MAVADDQPAAGKAPGTASRLGRIVEGNRFTLAFAAAALPVFLLVGYLVLDSGRRGAIETLIETTEAHHASMARLLANDHIDTISYLLALDISDAPELLPTVLERSELPRLVRASFPGTSVIKVKLYADNGMTLYSSDPAQVGEDRSTNPGVVSALAGTPRSELTHRGEFYAFEGGLQDLDVLSSYIPIRVSAADLVTPDAVFEIYSDVSSLIADIDATRRLVLLETAVPLGALYIVLVVTVAVAHTMLRRQELRAISMSAQAAEAAAANRAKSEFLSRMSHELRTPLNAIIGFSELIHLSYAERDPQTGEYAALIRRGGENLLVLVNDILDLTALELGKLKLEVSRVSIPDILRLVAEEERHRLETRNMRLSLRTAPDIPSIQADAGRLKQVFSNLVANAIRFTPTGGLVDIYARALPDGGVAVTIADTGIGMSPKDIEIVRQPFRQAEQHLARKHDGAGLGLTIAERLVELHGGVLTLESEPGKGTRIGIFLPDATGGRVTADAPGPVSVAA